jgi:peptidoglycan/LPS O-acetylase OafA/YrhL
MTRFFSQRFEPSTATTTASRDSAVEGLRGCAALAVLYGHLLAPMAKVDPLYAPSQIWWRVQASMMAILLFFILSGYVIGLTNRRLATQSSIGDYLRRRAVRLLPIYVVAVVFGWLVSHAASWRTLVGNLLLLQNIVPDSPFHVSLLDSNPNLWSLHYEVIYYLGFILVWLWRPPISATLALVAGVGILGVVVPSFSLWVAWLACGAVFWLAGLVIAWRLPQGPDDQTGPWPSALLLSVAIWKLQILHYFLQHLGFAIAWVPGVTFDYLDILPCLFWLFLIITRRQIRWLHWVEISCWGYVAAYVAWRLRHGLFPWHEEIVTDIGITVLALALRGWKPSLTFWRVLSPLGTISYALYALEAPVQYFVRGLLPSFAGTTWSYAVRVVIVVLLSFGLAWFFECWLQPRQKKLSRPHTTAAIKACMP